MGKKLLKIVLWFAAIQAAIAAIGMVASKQLSEGDETTDEFQIAAITGGRQFVSRAGALRSGRVIAAMGGVQLDLRNASLDPAGAELALDLTMGGVQVIVREDWRVDVEQHGAGEVETKVTPPDALPQGAPRLHVRAETRMGGAQVVAKPA
jgi:hypothetical protein